MKLTQKMTQMKQLVKIAICSIITFNATAQNSITLDPNSQTNNPAKVLVEGIGSVTRYLPYFLVPNGSVGMVNKIGLYAYPTTTENSSISSIVGVADKSTSTNIGVLGIGGGSSSSLSNYGGQFYGYGNTTSSAYGFSSNVHNQGTGSIYGGYVSVNNYLNASKNRYGLIISNNVNYNDTTKAFNRIGLHVQTTGKLMDYYSLTGINSSINTSSSDTVTYNNTANSIYASVSVKNKQTNYGVSSTASNYGTGSSVGGSFSANGAYLSTSDGNRTGISENAPRCTKAIAFVRVNCGL
jgi:hypothetical protein